jgi:Kef-type K+ transport system membrane component KefB
MKLSRNALFYIIVTSIFSALIYAIIQSGKALEHGRAIAEPTHSGHSPWNDLTETLAHNIAHPLAILLAQIIVIIITARLLSWLCQKIGQPAVVGEIIAGIVLGPSLLGVAFPEWSALLFPSHSLGNLQFLSQIGLILFMFVIGMELDLKVLRNRAQDAIVISHASIVVPFAMGITLAYYLYPHFAPASVKFVAFSLFMGIAMSITAFPVLARIVQERGIHKTRLGSIVITCAAADDVTAWSILAAVIAIVKAGSLLSSLYVIGLAVLYVLVMVFVVRPFLKRIGDLHNSREHLSQPVVAIFFVVLLLSSYATEVIGIHALFGAFMAGVIMPDNLRFRSLFIEKVEDVALVLLLPLFFVFTGLRTQIGLLNDPRLWGVCALIIGVAVAGKFLGSSLPARFVGQSWKDSFTIGILMNARGLMELVVLNIGYDLGVLSPEIFAMMVIMALATTFMTGPFLNLVERIYKKNSIPEKQKTHTELQGVKPYKILVSFGHPERGRSLLRLAHSLVRKRSSHEPVTIMHLSPGEELNAYNAHEYERDSFAPVLDESARLQQKIMTLFKPSIDVDSDIAETANQGDYDLLLIGLGQSIFEGSLLGKVLGFTTRIINPEILINKLSGKEKLFENSPFDERTRLILAKTEIPVGILIDKRLEKTERIFIPIFDAREAFLMTYAQKLIHHTGAQVVLLDTVGHVRNDVAFREAVRAIEHQAPNHIALLSENKLNREFLQQQDIMLVGLESWKKLIDSQSIWLNHTPSILILRP